MNLGTRSRYNGPIVTKGSHSLENLTAEPFRLFFPTGMIFGLLGVLLWPLFHAGWLPYYPSFAHTRLMISGFAAFFIFGFLMTAGPRLLGVPAFSRTAVLSVFSLSCAACIAQLFNWIVLGDLVFCASVGVVLSFAAQAYRYRSDCPPPGFPLAALGLASAFVGSLSLALVTFGWSNPHLFGLGKILLFQGFTLLPIVGVGAFFFPKLLGSRNHHDFPEMRIANSEWKRRFKHSCLVGICFLVSVVLELAGYIAVAYLLRLAALVGYCWFEIPFRELRLNRSLHGAQLLAILSTIAIGLAGAALFPAQKIAWLHAYFLVGLTGVIFLVSIRVVFGHSGRPDLILKSSRLSKWITGALVLAAATRIFADFYLSVQTSHYLYAAALWLVCGFVWLLFVAPKTMVTEPETSPSCHS